VSGQLHAPAALPPGKEPPVPIGQEVRWTPEPVWTTWRKFLTLPGLKLRPLGRPARSHCYTDYAIQALLGRIHALIFLQMLPSAYTDKSETNLSKLAI
jgi:hypothetical protein